MPSREILLSLREVEAQIAYFEQKYGITTADFLRSEGLEENIPEDDAFKWEAFVDHRRELKHWDEKVHRQYLSSLSRNENEPTGAPSPEDQLALAA